MIVALGALGSNSVVAEDQASDVEGEGGSRSMVPRGELQKGVKAQG